MRSTTFGRAPPGGVICNMGFDSDSVACWSAPPLAGGQAGIRSVAEGFQVQGESVVCFASGMMAEEEWSLRSFADPEIFMFHARTHHTSIIHRSYVHPTPVIHPSYTHHTPIMHPSYIEHTSIIHRSYAHPTSIIHRSFIGHASYIAHTPILQEGVREQMNELPYARPKTLYAQCRI